MHIIIMVLSGLFYLSQATIFSCEASLTTLKMTGSLADKRLAFLTYFDLIWPILTYFDLIWPNLT